MRPTPTLALTAPRSRKTLGHQRSSNIDIIRIHKRHAALVLIVSSRPTHGDVFCTLEHSNHRKPRKLATLRFVRAFSAVANFGRIDVCKTIGDSERQILDRVAIDDARHEHKMRMFFRKRVRERVPNRARQAVQQHAHKHSGG